MFEVLLTNRNKRYRHGKFLVEGVRNITGAVENGWRVHAFLYGMEGIPAESPYGALSPNSRRGKEAGRLSGWAREMLASVRADAHYQLTPPLMAELSGKTDTSELMAIVHMREEAMEGLALSPNPLLVLFDRPSNRGNLGTVIRSCDAFGADGLILTGHGVDPYDPDVVVATMGSFFSVPVARAKDHASVARYILALKARYPGLLVVGTTAHRERTVYETELSGPLLLLIGNETDGLSRALKECADTLVTIPMAEGCAASSLNVGCAASILLYEAARQRARTGSFV